MIKHTRIKTSTYHASGELPSPSLQLDRIYLQVSEPYTSSRTVFFGETAFSRANSLISPTMNWDAIGETQTKPSSSAFPDLTISSGSWPGNPGIPAPYHVSTNACIAATSTVRPIVQLLRGRKEGGIAVRTQNGSRMLITPHAVTR